MKFSIYSELQGWPGKQPDRSTPERSSRSSTPTGSASTRTRRSSTSFSEVFGVAGSDRALLRRRAAHLADQLPHARARPPVPQPDGAGVADRLADILRAAATSSASAAATAGSRRRAGVQYGEMLERYDDRWRSCSRRWSRAASRSRSTGKFYDDPRRADRPAAALRKFRVFAAAPEGRTCRRRDGWGVVVPPLLPYEALREQLDLYRSKCAESAPSRTSSGSTPATSTRTATPRSARPRRDQGLPRRERVAAGRAREAAGRRADRRRLRLLHGGDPGEAGRDAVRRDDRRRHRLGRARPRT